MGVGIDFPPVELDVSHRKLSKSVVVGLAAPVDTFVENVDQIVLLSQLPQLALNVVYPFFMCMKGSFIEYARTPVFHSSVTK